MVTRHEATAAPDLTRDSFVYLADGPRAGDTLEVGNHTGKICVGLVAGQVPRLGAELVYAWDKTYTAEGSRVYRLWRPQAD